MLPRTSDHTASRHVLDDVSFRCGHKAPALPAYYEYDCRVATRGLSAFADGENPILQFDECSAPHWEPTTLTGPSFLQYSTIVVSRREARFMGFNPIL